jgi:Tfp pilus assembly protein PilV
MFAIKKFQGISLLEVLISVAILSITVLTFVSVQISSLDAVRDGYTKKIMTELGNDFITQFNTDIAIQKSSTKRNEILTAYLGNHWNLNSGNCPVTGVVKTNCLQITELDKVDVCSNLQRIEFDVRNFQCDLIQNIPSAKMQFLKCDSTTQLHCLLISWNGEDNDYTTCKKFDSNCIAFEVLP